MYFKYHTFEVIYVTFTWKSFLLWPTYITCFHIFIIVFNRGCNVLLWTITVDMHNIKMFKVEHSLQSHYLLINHFDRSTKNYLIKYVLACCCTSLLFFVIFYEGHIFFFYIKLSGNPVPQLWIVLILVWIVPVLKTHKWAGPRENRHI